MKNEIKYNQSHCKDPTAAEAIQNVTSEQQRLGRLIDVIKGICWLAGFEPLNRLELRDKKTGRVWR